MFMNYENKTLILLISAPKKTRFVDDDAIYDVIIQDW